MKQPKDQTISGIYGFEQRRRETLPLFLSGISAGFPSPAEDYIENTIDLNEHLVRNPAATFFIRVAGDSMTGGGIHHDDILIVDRSLEPVSGKIVIAVINGELTVKRFIKDNSSCRLAAEHPDYDDLEITEETPLEIWGVVTYAIRRL